MVHTARVKDRRELRFGRLQDILDETERLGAAASIRVTGNWTPAQNVQHLLRVIEASLDGFDFTAPAPMRWLGRLLRDRALNRPMRPGFKLPRRMQSFVPDPDVSWEQALAGLRTVVGRIGSGERMSHASPFLGPLAHEEWEQLHCRHAEMHLGFLHPEGAAGSPAASAARDH